MARKPKPAPAEAPPVGATKDDPAPAEAAPEAAQPVSSGVLPPKVATPEPLGERAAFLARQFAKETPPGQDRKNDRFRHEQALKEFVAGGGKDHEIEHLRRILASNFGGA